MESIVNYECNIRDSRCFNQAFQLFREKLPDVTIEFLFNKPLKLQHTLTEIVYNKVQNDFLCSADQGIRANTLSYTMPTATEYLVAQPSVQLGLAMSSAEFQVSLCRQLRIPLFPSGADCPKCGSHFMDVFGDHALTCSTGGDLIARHNNIRNLLYHFCKASSLNPSLETNHLSSSNNRRPGDITIPNWSRGSLLALDVTICSPLQASLITQAAEKQGVAASRAEERKFGQFNGHCQSDGVVFSPFAMETSAGLGEHALKFAKELAARHADNNFRDRSQSSRDFFQRLSDELHRSNAVMIISRMSSFAASAESLPELSAFSASSFTSSSQVPKTTLNPVGSTSRNRPFTDAETEVSPKKPRSTETSTEHHQQQQHHAFPIKLDRRSKNEKVILSKDCDKISSRSNGLMTSISPRSLTTSLTPFASYNDLKSPLKPFVPGCSYTMADSYLSPRNTGYPLPFDYPAYRPEAYFYIPTQPTAGGIYSGMIPMEPINSFDIYSSASVNTSAPALNGMAPMANLPGSPSNILPSVHMPKHQSEASNLAGPKLANHSAAAVSNSPEGYPSSNNDTSTAQNNSALMTSPFLTHQSVSSGHGFFGANQDIPGVPSFNANSVTQGLHNAAVDSYNSSCSWSIMDHIATS